MRNLSAKADGVGDTLPATDFNANLRSELQNIVTSAGLTLDPEGGPDTDVEMLGKATTLYANAALYYQDSGAANAYVLARVGNLKALTSYIDGVTVVFKAGNANSGASTINVDSLGSKALVSNFGAALVSGEVTSSGYVIARYHSSNDNFEIVQSQSTADLPVPSSINALQNIQVNEDGDGYELVGPLTSFKNKIINGNFDFWHYGTSQTSSGYASDDRWLNLHSGSTKTHSRQAFTLGQTDVPGNPDYFSRTVVTTGGGASDYVRKTQPIEYVKTLSGESSTVSFWAKADSSKDIAVELYQYFGSGGSPSAIVDGIGVTTVNLTSSWAKYYLPISIPSISGKSIGTSITDSLSINLWFDAGSDFNSSTNSLGNQSGTFDLARVQVEPGPVETAYEELSISVVRDLCRRYNFRWDIAAGIAVNGTIRTATICRVPWPQDYISKLRGAISVTQSGTMSCLFQSTGTATATYSSGANSIGTFTLVTGGGGSIVTGEGILMYPFSANYMNFSSELLI